MTRQFLLFLVSGGIAAALNWGSRFLFSRWMAFEWAVVCAYGVGMATAFILMRTLAFDGRGKPAIPQAGRFALVNAAALAQTWIVSVAMTRWVLPSVGITTHAEALGHLVGVLFPVFTSYIAHRKYTFR